MTSRVGDSHPTPTKGLPPVPKCATLPTMPLTTDPRIADLARRILNHTITADAVHPDDRAAVQELLTVWWVERGLQRRVTGSIPAYAQPLDVARAAQRYKL